MNARALLERVRPHALFLVLLGAGAVLRLLALVAYRPVLIYWDSVGYLAQAGHLRPDPTRPLGYPGFLRVLSVFHTLSVVPLAQHLIGLAIGALIYFLLLRLGLPRWVAALAAAPVLLDSFQVNLEEYVLSETLFEFFVVAACVALLWYRKPGWRTAALTGLLLAAVALTRANGLVVIVPALIALVCLRWEGRRRRQLRPMLPAVLALLLAFAVPLAAYAAWFDRVHGQFAITTWGGRFLYARVAAFADCSKVSVPPDEAQLCPTQKVGHRPTIHGSTVEYYMWGRRNSPVWKLAPDKQHSLPGDFAKRVILGQPITYLKVVGKDFLRSFAPTRTRHQGETPIARWQFQLTYPIYASSTLHILRTHGDGLPTVHRRPAVMLRFYQRFGYTPGPLLALGLIAALLAAAGVWRARRSGLRSAAFLFVAMGLLLFCSTLAANKFNWRYELVQLVLFPPAAAIGATALLRTPL